MEGPRGFYGCQPARGIQVGAVVLATVEDARGEGRRPQPFLVTMRAGKGRVLYVGSGELWRLRQFREEYHERLWRRLLAHAAGVGAKK
jgi:hypothetical protein